MREIIRLTESDLCKIIKESVTSILSESKGIKSQKLYDIMKQHKGIKSNHGIFDIHNLTDNDIIGVFSYSDIQRIYSAGGYKKFAKINGINLGIADDLNTIELNDGKYILAILRGSRFDSISKDVNSQREKQPGDFELLHNKTSERYKNRFPRKEYYVWNNADASDLFHNPYFRRKEGNWTTQRRKEVMNNIKNGKRWFDND